MGVENSQNQGGTIHNLASQANEKASGAYSYAQRSLNRVVSPSTRQETYDRVAAFASERPILFSFLFTLLLLSFFPLFLFTAFAISTVFLSLAAAVLFSLFWVGLALLFLVPTLLVTFSISVLVWAWAVGSFLVARWIYFRIPVGVNADVKVKGWGKEVGVKKDEQGVAGDVKDL